jgi:hypothetical protein
VLFASLILQFTIKRVDSLLRFERGTTFHVELPLEP